MSRTSKLLTKETVALAESNLLRLGKTGAVAVKLRAIISASKHGITTVAKCFGITKGTLISWIKHVKNESLELLTVQKGRGRKNIVTDEHKKIIRQWIESDSQITIDRLKSKITTELGMKIGRSTVHRLMKSLSYSYITPRPIHYKQDQAKFPEAKKKSSRED